MVERLGASISPSVDLFRAAGRRMGDSTPDAEERSMTNTELMRDGYAAYSRRDYSFVDELFAPDIRFAVPAEVGGEFVGRDQVKEFFNGLAQQFARHEIVLDDAVESGDRLVCFVHHRFETQDGNAGEVEAVHDWRFRDGKIASMREVADTLAIARLSGQAPA
jgi:ketosteroid isomerase-like protein